MMRLQDCPAARQVKGVEVEAIRRRRRILARELTGWLWAARDDASRGLRAVRTELKLLPWAFTLRAEAGPMRNTGACSIPKAWRRRTACAATRAISMQSK